MSAKEKRSQKIIETAIKLAEKGGFSAVRLREVASRAGVALGTVYKRFQSKEDLLVAALDLEMRRLHEQLGTDTFSSEEPLERITHFFTRMTEYLCSRPNLARAVLRALSAGEPELTGKVTAFYGRVSDMILEALYGRDFAQKDSLALVSVGAMERVQGHSRWGGPEQRLASALQHIWFASLVGWAGGAHDQEGVVAEVASAADLLLRGIGHLT